MRCARSLARVRSLPRPADRGSCYQRSDSGGGGARDQAQAREDARDHNDGSACGGGGGGGECARAVRLHNALGTSDEAAAVVTVSARRARAFSSLICGRRNRHDGARSRVTLVVVVAAVVVIRR